MFELSRNASDTGDCRYANVTCSVQLLKVSSEADVYNLPHLGGCQGDICGKHQGYSTCTAH